MKCSIQSCDRESRSGGMCNRHYESKRRTGRAETGKRITPYGMPAVRTDGYVRLRVDGARQLAHVVVAEQQLAGHCLLEPLFITWTGTDRTTIR